jgi:hypothetical protein
MANRARNFPEDLALDYMQLEALLNEARAEVTRLAKGHDEYNRAHLILMEENDRMERELAEARATVARACGLLTSVKPRSCEERDGERHLRFDCLTLTGFVSNSNPTMADYQHTEACQLAGEVAAFLAEPHGRDLLAELEALRTVQDAAAKVCAGFDAAIFVRNTDGDGASDWAIKAFPYLRALGILAEAAALRATQPEPDAG